MASQRGFAAARRHIGLYAYRVAALRRLSLLQPSPLELVEKLEQLRALENGMEIRVADASESPGLDVNTAEDLARVALLLGAGESQ
jgi:3-deoxy-manno-octulosonate cytidylyltransferase (CMP-KDO synthetase)